MHNIFKIHIFEKKVKEKCNYYFNYNYKYNYYLKNYYNILIF